MLFEQLAVKVTSMCQRSHHQPEGVLCLPYISEAVSYHVRKVVRRSGIKIGIVQNSGPTLRSILTRPALDPPRCPGRSDCLACQAGLEGRCTIKNIVYRLTCTLCSGIYTGETKRPVRDRLMEHRRAVRNGDDRNPLGAYFLQVHANI